MARKRTAFYAGEKVRHKGGGGVGVIDTIQVKGGDIPFPERPAYGVPVGGNHSQYQWWRERDIERVKG